LPFVKAIHIAPVKSLGLAQPNTVHVSPQGIVEDRRLHLVNGPGRLLTQRELGRLVQVKAEYRADPEWLCLRFPDGDTVEGTLALGEAVNTPIWGRQVAGHAVTGDWNRALSDFCQQPIRLVRSDQPGQCYDEFPISLLSQASLQALSRQPRLVGVIFDSRRFRPNFLLDGCQAHEEDTWLGGAVQIGESARLRVVAPDPRCAITTHNPETGECDVDTPSLIKSYRPSPRAAYFGVYALVEQPGPVSLGDVVTAQRS
jgi:uncharacterized protein YcbX